MSRVTLYALVLALLGESVAATAAVRGVTHVVVLGFDGLSPDGIEHAAHR